MYMKFYVICRKFEWECELFLDRFIRKHNGVD